MQCRLSKPAAFRQNGIMSANYDQQFMEAAVRLARQHEGWTATNPSVSCLLVRDGENGPRIVGVGVTAIGGRPHAEPIALAEAGDLASGATAYVTLEPCAHHGRTPPCAQTLINGGVARVVSAVVDPDERVNERGHAMLRDAGITVEAGVGETAARVDLAAYLMHKNVGRPHVTLKLAVSTDGKIGLKGKGSLPITGPISRAQTHMMRARHQAILVGAGTAAADDPELTCRLPGLEQYSPIRIVLDPNGRIGPDAKLVKSARQYPVLIVAPPGQAEHAKLLEAGCEIVACEIEDGRVALPELLDDLGSRGIMSLLVEGGAQVAASFLADDLVDAISLFAGPESIGEREAVDSPVTAETMPPGFELTGRWQFGEDRMMEYRRKAD